jgi:DNA-binding GntR family transcriptional regulator
MIDPMSGVPVYRQLADDLRERILAGEFPPSTAVSIPAVTCGGVWEP